MTAILFTLISIVVITTLSWLDRNERGYYYFGVAIIAGGLGLSFWGYQNSSIKADDYVRKLVQIVSVSKRESGNTLVFETVDGDFLFDGAYLDGGTKNRFLSIPWANDDAVIWLGSPSSHMLTGFESKNIKVEPQSIAALHNIQNRKLANIGFVVVGVGVLIMILHYLPRRLGVRE